MKPPASGAAESPPDERQGRNAGLRLLRQGHDREQVRGGADEDVSDADNMICPQIEAVFGPPWEIVFALSIGCLTPLPRKRFSPLTCVQRRCLTPHFAPPRPIIPPVAGKRPEGPTAQGLRRL